jgi:hypothetical protein
MVMGAVNNNSSRESLDAEIVDKGRERKGFNFRIVSDIDQLCALKRPERADRCRKSRAFGNTPNVSDGQHEEAAASIEAQVR